MNAQRGRLADNNVSSAFHTVVLAGELLMVLSLEVCE